MSLRLALLGDPVGHSRSPLIHAAALAALGMPGEYEARRTDEAGVRAAVDEMRRGALDGANVTMPLKRAALDAVDSASLEAIRAGAVNTLVLRSGAVTGENTDVGGIGDVVERGGFPPDTPVLVLGAGGAAAAAVLAFEDRAPAVSARRRDAAAVLAESTGVTVEAIGWGIGVPGAIVVNATPLGMGGEHIPRPVLEQASGLVDLAYGPEATPAAAWARGRIPLADGLDVLVAQAARSFTLWTGTPAPIDVMERAARV